MSNSADDTVVQMRGANGATKQIPIIGAVTEAFGRFGDKAKSAVETTDDFVRDSPWQAVGLVAVIGLGIGMLAAWAAAGASRRAARNDRALRQRASDWAGDL